jgi:hypothetical protein
VPTFAQLDPILVAWANDRGFPLLTSYKEVEVRSFDVDGPSDTRCQIWVETRRGRRRVSVSVWDYAIRRCDFDADISSLEARLDDALATARSWF